ncbi:MAG: FTR1 family protein [Alphaproteobacteria bacterium]|nr:FTR1 family protein [Alphaproteobacteria bacterium]
MLETLVIAFREGLEAFLIVAITLAYLNKTGRGSLNKAVFAGIGAALLMSATTGWHVKDLAEDPRMEAGLAMLAGLLVASLTVMMMRAAKTMGRSVTDKLETHATKGGFLAMAGVFGFTVVMIAREGMELALMVGTMASYLSLPALAGGLLGGFGLVAVIGALWVSQSTKINLKLFMQVTGVFLVLFAVHLFVFGIHEISEMSALPFLGADVNYAVHVATEPFGHDSPYAHFVTYSLLLLPCAWLGFAYMRERFAGRLATVAKG